MPITIQYAGPINDVLTRAAAASAYASASRGGGGGAMSVGSRGGGGGGGRADPFALQANALDAQAASQERVIEAQADRDARLNSYQAARDEQLHGYTGERLQQQAEIAQAHDERSYAQRTQEMLMREGAPLTFVETQSMNQLANARGAVMGREDLSEMDRGRALREIDQRLNPLLQRQDAFRHRQGIEQNNMRLQAFSARRLDWPDVNSPPVMGEDGQPERYPDDHPHFAGQIVRQRSIPMLLDQHGMPQRIPMNERPVITPEIWGNWHRNITASMPMPQRQEGQTEPAHQAEVATWRQNVDRQMNEMRDSWHRMNQDNQNPDNVRARSSALAGIEERLNPIIAQVTSQAQAFGMTVAETNGAASDLRQLQLIAQNPTQANLNRVPALLAGLPPAIRDRLEPPPPRDRNTGILGGAAGVLGEAGASGLSTPFRRAILFGPPPSSPPQDRSRITNFMNEVNTGVNPFLGDRTPEGNFFARLNTVAQDASLPPQMRQDLAQIRDVYRQNPRNWRSLRMLINTLPPEIRNRLGQLPIPEVMTRS